MTDTLDKRDTFAAALNRQGYSDLLVLRCETGHETLSPDRLAIIQHLANQDERESLDVLAQKLSRDVDALHKDLSRLAELDVITFDRTAGKPRPVLKHEHVIVEPIY